MNVTPAIIFSVISIIVQVITFAVTLSWAVGKIRTSTAVLHRSCQGLERSIEHLSEMVENNRKSIIRHGNRIVRLETKTGVNPHRDENDA